MWRYRILAIVGLFLFLTLSLSPTVPPAPPPSAADVIAARSAFDRVRGSAGTGKATETFISWQEARGGSVLLGRALGIERVRIEPAAGEAKLLASIGAGFVWANLQASVETTRDGFPTTHARVGLLPIPGFLTRWVLEGARLYVNLRGPDLPPLDTMVRRLAVRPAGLSLVLALPRKTKLFGQLNAAQANPVDPVLVASHYCRLSEAQLAQPTFEMATHVRRAFEGPGSVADNRAALVALAMLSVSPSVGNLAAGTGALTDTCRLPAQQLTLLGRTDLAKHWALSAALAALFGEDLSQSMGTWKEIADSGANGSGFSFVDLAADRSGIHHARRASDEATAASERARLSTVSEEQLVPVRALAFAEGMTEAEFQSRYTSTESPEYKRVVEVIDRVLSVEK